MNQIIRKLFLFTIIISIGIVMYLFYGKNDYLIPDCRKVINLELGSTIETVISKIGVPLTIEGKWITHSIKDCNRNNIKTRSNVKNENHLYSIFEKFEKDTTYCCESFKNSKKTQGFVLTYSQVKWFEDYTMLWIHLDREYKLIGVYSKFTDGWDTKKELYKNYTEDYYLDPKFCDYLN